jgi:hypothetical protein
MNYGESFRLYVADYLRQYNLPSLGRIDGKILAELADRHHIKWLEALKAAKKAKKEGGGRSSPVPDAEWLKTVAASPAYRGLDVNLEVEKCRVWCETNKKTFSRRRIVNWLNGDTTHRTVEIPRHTASSTNHPNADKNLLYSPPSFDYARFIAVTWPREDHPYRRPWEEMRWLEIPVDIRAEILRLYRLQAPASHDQKGFLPGLETDERARQTSPASQGNRLGN